MGKIKAIALKELKGFFLSPNFYFVCFLACALFSWVYPISLSQFAESLNSAFMMPDSGGGQSMNIHYGVFLRHWSQLNLVLIFIVPALTMRLFSEEKKMKTMDLLLTSPVTSLEIVLGKYIAALGVVVFLVFLGFLYPLATSYFAKINWAPLLIAFLGAIFTGAIFAAVNIFASSLTESAIVAFVMAVVFNIAIWMMGLLLDVVDSSAIRQIFEYISIPHNMFGFAQGTIKSSTVIYFLSLIGLFVFLTERVIESVRWR